MSSRITKERTKWSACVTSVRSYYKSIFIFHRLVSRNYQKYIIRDLEFIEIGNVKSKIRIEKEAMY